MQCMCWSELGCSAELGVIQGHSSPQSYQMRILGKHRMAWEGLVGVEAKTVYVHLCISDFTRQLAS